jgi:archaellum component FlaC
MAQWENLKTDGERIRWLSENLSAVMGMLHRETEQINALQQRVQVLEEEIEKLIGLPLRHVP